MLTRLIASARPSPKVVNGLSTLQLSVATQPLSAAQAWYAETEGPDSSVVTCRSDTGSDKL
jgi:hypothetical protein